MYNLYYICIYCVHPILIPARPTNFVEQISVQFQMSEKALLIENWSWQANCYWLKISRQFTYIVKRDYLTSHCLTMIFKYLQLKQVQIRILACYSLSPKYFLMCVGVIMNRFKQFFKKLLVHVYVLDVISFSDSNPSSPSRCPTA